MPMPRCLIRTRSSSLTGEKMSLIRTTKSVNDGVDSPR